MKHEFKIGDRIKIRQWDDMVKEFGTETGRDIKMANCGFVSSMKHLCGRTATLTNITSDGEIELKDWSDTSGDIAWNYCTDMIEPAESVKPLIMIYPNRKNPNETIAVRKNGNVVVDTAKAIYNPVYEKDGDTYSFEKGAKIAVKRLLGIKIDDKPTYKEVKRKAKAGEYVKIVHAEATSDCYENGDIFCAIKTEDGGVYFTTRKTHPSCEQGCSYAWDEEYVVLEGYQPTVEQNAEPQKFDISSCSKAELLAELDRRL